MVAAREARARGLWGRVWDASYATGYHAVRALVLLCFRPLFLVRTVGRAPPIPSGPLIVCANHASYLDPVFVQLLVPRRIVFVMTNDFYRRGWGRWFFGLVGAIPVGAGRSAKTGIQRAVALLRRGMAIGIFPEGRLSMDGTLGLPQRGVAVIARLAPAPVLPLGLAGNLHAWPKGRGGPRRADVRAAFGALIPSPSGEHGRGRQEEEALPRRVFEAIREACQRASRGGRVSRPGHEASTDVQQIGRPGR